MALKVIINLERGEARYPEKPYVAKREEVQGSKREEIDAEQDRVKLKDLKEQLEQTKCVEEQYRNQSLQLGFKIKLIYCGHIETILERLPMPKVRSSKRKKPQRASPCKDSTKAARDIKSLVDEITTTILGIMDKVCDKEWTEPISEFTLVKLKDIINKKVRKSRCATVKSAQV